MISTLPPLTDHELSKVDTTSRLVLDLGKGQVNIRLGTARVDELGVLDHAPTRTQTKQHRKKKRNNPNRW